MLCGHSMLEVLCSIQGEPQLYECTAVCVSGGGGVLHAWGLRLQLDI